jgi:hypothetical protein
MGEEPGSPKYEAATVHGDDYVVEAQDKEDAFLLRQLEKRALCVESYVKAVLEECRSGRPLVELRTPHVSSVAFPLLEFISLLGAVQHLSSTRIPTPPPIAIRAVPKPAAPERPRRGRTKK